MLSGTPWKSGLLLTVARIQQNPVSSYLRFLLQSEILLTHRLGGLGRDYTPPSASTRVISIFEPGLGKGMNARQDILPPTSQARSIPSFVAVR